MNNIKYKEILYYLKLIISGTKYENHVFTVGGCNRDYIMSELDNTNVQIKDIDMVVDLPNGGIEFAEWLFENSYLVREPITYPTYGTAMFVLKAHPDVELEVVETRKEKYKNRDSRNPEVTFGTLEEDCRRRDLTINAIYCNVSTGKMIDLIGGIDDIKKKIIRSPMELL